MEQIELVHAIPELKEKYVYIVNRAIELNIITLHEWNRRFKFYRDESGYSFIHYLNCMMKGINNFITSNEIMINNGKELEKRFGVKVITINEFFPAFNL